MKFINISNLTKNESKNESSLINNTKNISEEEKLFKNFPKINPEEKENILSDRNLELLLDKRFNEFKLSLEKNLKIQRENNE